MEKWHQAMGLLHDIDKHLFIYRSVLPNLASWLNAGRWGRSGSSMLTRLAPTKAKVNLKHSSHGVPPANLKMARGKLCASSVARQAASIWQQCELFGKSKCQIYAKFNVYFSKLVVLVHLSPSPRAFGLGNTAIESETACRSCYIYYATVYMHTCIQTY